jgi:hypothetical protein
MTNDIRRPARLLSSLILAFAAASISQPAMAVSSDDLRWSGDLRYRFGQLRESTDDTRPYQQIRARLGLRARVQDDLEAILKLATATSAVSNNQALGDSTSPGMARRTFGIDQAFGDWKFADQAKLWIGRTANPFFAPGRTQFVFDHDLAFEGMSASYTPKWTDSSAFATFGGFIISENYSAPRDSVDTGLVGLDVGYSFTGIGQWTIHAARYHYLNVADQLMTRLESGAAIDRYSTPFERYRGNSVYKTAAATYNMAFGFTQTELGFEWKVKEEAVEFTGYFDAIINELAGAKGDAWEIGANTKFGRLQALVAYARKKSDSLIGAFTDSDFNGGGTDNEGTKISLSYALSDRSNVVLTDYRGTRGLDSTRRDYNAQHLDLSLQF